MCRWHLRFLMTTAFFCDHGRCLAEPLCHGVAADLLVMAVSPESNISARWLKNNATTELAKCLDWSTAALLLPHHPQQAPSALPPRPFGERHFVCRPSLHDALPNLLNRDINEFTFFENQKQLISAFQKATVLALSHHHGGTIPFPAKSKRNPFSFRPAHTPPLTSMATSSIPTAPSRSPNPAHLHASP